MEINIAKQVYKEEEKATLTIKSDSTTLLTVTATAFTVVKTITATAGVTIGTAKGLNLGPTATPASNATGTAGMITWDASYIYVCTAANTWERAALTGGY